MICLGEQTTALEHRRQGQRAGDQGVFVLGL